MAALRAGVVFKDGPTLPAQDSLTIEPAWFWSLDPPVRFRQSIPTRWLELRLRDGRNRQVQRMTGAGARCG